MQFFTKPQRVVGEFNFIQPDFPYRRWQHPGDREAMKVSFTRGVALLPLQTANFPFKLYAANARHRFRLTIDRSRNWRARARHLRMAGFIIR
ncbi:hypothetical protein SS209_04132 [Salmonella enterica subsp. enterica serovar Senftenberg str. SS209]|nr:hypothetical protein SS209_04132 [Salmonella enterica subsp. enterica serovar Senftenberg str. SS209]